MHKAECSCLNRSSGRIVPDAARVLTRIILKLNDGGDTEKGYYTETFYRKFKDLMSRKKILIILYSQTCALLSIEMLPYRLSGYSK